MNANATVEGTVAAFAGEARAFFLPSIFHPLWGEWASTIFYGRLVLPTYSG